MSTEVANHVAGYWIFPETVQAMIVDARFDCLFGRIC